MKNRSNIIKDDLWAFADDYVPVYKPKVGLDGKIMGGPWPEYVLVGYRAKTPNEKKVLNYINYDLIAGGFDNLSNPTSYT